MIESSPHITLFTRSRPRLEDVVPPEVPDHAITVDDVPVDVDGEILVSE